MRHRKVLNLYDTDINHEDLLVYLESIEGSTRQSQALVQMALIGFRVTVLHESGDQAYYSVRNPDAAAALGKKKLAARESKRPLAMDKITQPKTSAPTESMVDHDEKTLHKKPIAPEAAVIDENRAYSSDNDNHHDDEYNTLRILRDMAEGQ